MNVDAPEPDEDELDEAAAEQSGELEASARQRQRAFPRSPFAPGAGAPGAPPPDESALPQPAPQFFVSPFTPRAPTRPGVTPPITLAPGGPVEQ